MEKEEASRLLMVSSANNQTIQRKIKVLLKKMKGEKEKKQREDLKVGTLSL